MAFSYAGDKINIPIDTYEYRNPTSSSVQGPPVVAAGAAGIPMPPGAPSAAQIQQMAGGEIFDL